MSAPASGRPRSGGLSRLRPSGTFDELPGKALVETGGNGFCLQGSLVAELVSEALPDGPEIISFRESSGRMTRELRTLPGTYTIRLLRRRKAGERARP